MYQNAYEMITQSGYNSIGMDHFSKPSDQFSVAQQQRKLHRNFQGYCTTETTGQVYGFGASSISQLYSSYSQNEKNAAKYIKNIRNKKIPVIRGYSLNNNEKIIRDIINQVMCNFYVDLKEVAKNHNKDIATPNSPSMKNKKDSSRDERINSTCRLPVHFIINIKFFIFIQGFNNR